MKLNKLFLTVLAGSLFFVSCNDDELNDVEVSSGIYDDGVLILNQGGFNHGDASVSFLSDGFELENNIYTGVTGLMLGDTGQDIGLNGDLAYIVLNNSQKVEIVKRYTFEHVATIDNGLSNPRYIAFYNGKGYITNWGDGTNTADDYVAVVDLATNRVTSTIQVAEGPERIIVENGMLYVAHAGGYGYGHTVSVINAQSNAVVTSINVGDVPNSLEVANGKLYVLSGGMPSWAGTETNGKLHVINTANNSIVTTKEFTGVHPSNLDIEAGSIYYTEDAAVYKMDLATTALPSAPLFTTTDQGAYGIYSFAVKNNHIYLGDAGDYNSNGKVYVHTLDGMLHETFTVGVIPAGFYFND